MVPVITRIQITRAFNHIVNTL